MLRRRGRVTHRALKRQFGIDDDFLADLVEEIVRGQRLATEEDGAVLVWAGPPAEQTAGGVAPVSPGAPSAAASVSTSPATDLAPPTQSAAADEATPPHAHDVTIAERRQITVMFCDLVGSTRLSGQLDPEDFREVLRAYQECCDQRIREFDGHVAQLLGDGILVYFGYPRAHEDDASRSLRSALAIVAALGPLNQTLQARWGVTIQVRFGIHTGMVVIGSMGGASRSEELALGEAPNVAARLQSLAEPNAIVVSDTTRRLTTTWFEFSDLGVQELKGVSEPVQAWRVVGTSRTRAADADSPAATEIVGRAPELALLRDRWEQAQDGRVQVVLLSGEAGIGKSQLIESAWAQMRSPDAQRVAYRCSPYYANTALYPIIEQLSLQLGFVRDEPAPSRLDKIEAFVAAARPESEDAVQILAQLLSVHTGDRYPALNLTPQRRAQRARDLLIELMLGAARERPVLATWDDLHWADATTLELIGLLIDPRHSARLLTVLVFRPEFRPPWPAGGNVSWLALNRFTATQVEQLTRRFLGGKALPREVLDQIVAKTDGVPLFVEEVTKLLLESGVMREGQDAWELTGPLPALAVPTTLQGSLMARLDRLQTAREVAQIGASIGREFLYELILAVGRLDEETLRTGLRRLVDAELVYERGAAPDSSYVFKHALIQDVAYQSLLRSTRQQLHQRIAKVLESRFAADVKTHPELLAHHCTVAGLVHEAIPLWHRAGELAIERSAHVEAIAHLTQGLELVAALPEAPERDRWELELRVTLGVPLTATRGYGDAEVERTYARARALSHVVGEVPQVFRALYGLWRSHLLRAEYDNARALAEELLAMAESVGETPFLAAANRALGGTLFYMGEFARSATHLEAVLTAYPSDADRSRSLIQDVYDVVDPRVTAHSYLAWGLWMRGFPDRAAEASDTAITMARDLDHPFSIALALSFSEWLHQFRGETAATRDRAGAAIRLSSEQHFPFWIGWGRVLTGWAQAEDGALAEGAASILAGLADWRQQGSELGRPYFLSLLAAVQSKSGRPDEAAASLSEAKALGDRTQENWCTPDILRRQAVLAHGGAHTDEAEALCAKSLQLARSQGSAAFVLRAATDLCRMRHGTEREAEARTQLRTALAAIEGGADTADVAAAIALLSEE